MSRSFSDYTNPCGTLDGSDICLYTNGYSELGVNATRVIESLLKCKLQNFLELSTSLLILGGTLGLIGGCFCCGALCICVLSGSEYKGTPKSDEEAPLQESYLDKYGTAQSSFNLFLGMVVKNTDGEILEEDESLFNYEGGSFFGTGFYTDKKGRKLPGEVYVDKKGKRYLFK